MAQYWKKIQPFPHDDEWIIIKSVFHDAAVRVGGKQSGARAVVVAQLVEHLLPPSDIRGSNPVIGKFYLLPAALKRYWKAKNKEKEPGEGPI